MLENFKGEFPNSGVLAQVSKMESSEELMMVMEG